jgi:tetratricopeptide (TPR) repeat protein
MSRDRSALAALSACALLLVSFPALSAQPAPAAPTAPQAASTPVAPSPDLYAGASADCRKVLDEASGLIASGKWKSAYSALEAFDKGNADPWALALRIEICMRGYVQTRMHRSFSLVDLEQGQTLEALRAGDGQYELFDFDPAAAAQAQEAAGVESPLILTVAMGDYYFGVQDLFSGQWFVSDEEVCTRALACYERAITAGLSNPETFVREGILLLRFEQPVEAEALIRKALALDSGYPDAHLNLAIAVGQQGRFDEAYAAVDSALAGYRDADHRYMAYMLGARIAAASDRNRAEAYLSAAEKEFPQDPSPGLFRHMLAIQLDDTEAANAAADAVLDRFPDSPYVVRTILTDWLGKDDLDLAMGFLDRSLARMAGKDACLGILGFYKALLITEVKGTEGYAEAMAVLDAAEANFRKAYAPDNQVFSAVAQLRAQLAQAGAALPAGQPASPAPAPAAPGQGSVAPTATTP